MDLNYTEQQEMLRTMVRDFAQNEIAPDAEERDRTGQFDYDLYRRLGGLGAIGMCYPEEFGGINAEFLSYCLAVEEVARADLSMSWTMLVASFAAELLIEGSTTEQLGKWRGKYILPVARGEAVGAGGITEPGAGSDTAAIQTTAVLDGDEWVINGSKAFITNAGLDNCPFTVAVCLTDRENRQFDLILVPTGTPGFIVQPAYRKMGLRSKDTRELAFEDCRVPADHVVGGAGGEGRLRIVQGLAKGRIALCSSAIGLHQACMDESLRYAKERVAFKRPISKFQHIQAMLVDMALELELSRFIRDKTATLIDQCQPHMKEASMAKYFCCESAKKAADRAVQIHGAIGYMDECPVSRYYRDIRAATIADGTTEIQKWIIARELGC